MENPFKKICSYIGEVLGWHQSLSESKMSSEQAKNLFNIVDIKRKGYLDLSQVLDLVGKVSEEDLFKVFKFLDCNKNGQISEQCFQQCFTNPSCSNSNANNREYLFKNFYKIVDSIKDQKKIFTQYKVKNGIDRSYLKRLYEFILQNMRTRFLSLDDLVYILKVESEKLQFEWNQKVTSLIKEMFASKRLTEETFIQVFGVQSVQQKIDTNVDESKCERIYLKQQREDHKENYESKARNNRFENQQKTPKFNYKIQSPPKYETRVSPVAQRIEQKRETEDIIKQIQKRREQLRKDSLDRKRMIEDLMNRKRMTTDSSCGDWNQFDNSKLQSQISSSFGTDNSSNIKKYSAKNHKNGCFNTSAKNQGQHRKSYLNQMSYKQEQDEQVQYQPRLNRYENNWTGTQLPKRQPQRYQQETQNKQQFSRYRHANELVKKYTDIRSSSGYVSPHNQLQKCTSGYLNQNQSYLNRSPPMERAERNSFDSTKVLKKTNSSFKFGERQYSKQNIMRRAEDEANRKIEEIERKARMKILEKKNFSGKRVHRDELQFGSKFERRALF